MTCNCNTVCNSKHSISEKFDSKKNSIHSLPVELLSEIFSYLNYAELENLRFVSKDWKEITLSLLHRIIYRERAFGSDKWKHYLGPSAVQDEDDKESLPVEAYLEDCKKIKSLFPGKSAKDSLMLVWIPKTLSGKFTLRSLEMLIKERFPNNNTFKSTGRSIIQVLSETSIDESYWVLMTKDILPGSGYESYDQQTKRVATLAAQSLPDYRIPKTLETVACIWSQYFMSETRLFSQTSTRCEEEIQGIHATVGIFSNEGLDIDNNPHDTSFIGVAPLRAFKTASKTLTAASSSSETLS